LRLIGALLAEQNEVWQERRYFDMDAFNEWAAQHPISTTDDHVVILKH